MNMTSRSRGPIFVLELSGRFDANTVTQVKKEFDGVRTSSVIVNLSGVHFIDSAGLSTLISGLKRCRQDGGDLFLCNLQQPVQIIFELTNLHRAFEIFASEDAAVAQFKC